jgi:hypothetical protein
MGTPFDLTPVEGNGEVVVFQVQDPWGRTIPSATLRDRDEKVAHRVNPRSGRWRAEGLYLDDRTVVFTPGNEIELDVRAPGYVPLRIRYEVSGHHNKVVVTLFPIGGVVRGRRGWAEADVETLSADLAWVERDRELAITPAFVHTLADGDATAAGSMAVSLLSRGPEHTGAAFAWATEALYRGRGLEGDAFVALTDRMLAVRALAATTDWRLEDLAFLAGDAADSEGRRRRAEQAAVDWLDYARAAGTDTGVAQELCRSATLSFSRCE